MPLTRPTWQNADHRRETLPPDWPRRRARVLDRDGHACTWTTWDGTRCGDTATEVDHIRPGTDHSYENLRSLCSWHHQRKSSSEGAKAQHDHRARMARRFARIETHPGLLED